MANAGGHMPLWQARWLTDTSNAQGHDSNSTLSGVLAGGAVFVLMVGVLAIAWCLEASRRARSSRGHSPEQSTEGTFFETDPPTPKAAVVDAQRDLERAVVRQMQRPRSAPHIVISTSKRGHRQRPGEVSKGAESDVESQAPPGRTPSTTSTASTHSVGPSSRPSSAGSVQSLPTEGPRRAGHHRWDGVEVPSSNAGAANPSAGTHPRRWGAVRIAPGESGESFYCLPGARFQPQSRESPWPPSHAPEPPPKPLWSSPPFPATKPQQARPPSRSHEDSRGQVPQPPPKEAAPRSFRPSTPGPQWATTERPKPQPAAKAPPVSSSWSFWSHLLRPFQRARKPTVADEAKGAAPKQEENLEDALITSMMARLDATRREPLAVRKGIFRGLQRELHPDKNGKHEEAAKHAFQRLMEQRAFYLRP